MKQNTLSSYQIQNVHNCKIWPERRSLRPTNPAGGSCHCWLHRGEEYRRDPDRVHAQFGDLVQPVQDSLQVADPVAAIIHKTARVDLVETLRCHQGDLLSIIDPLVIWFSLKSYLIMGCVIPSGRVALCTWTLALRTRLLKKQPSIFSLIEIIAENYFKVSFKIFS